MLPHNAVAKSDLDAAIEAIAQTFQDAAMADGNDETRRLLLEDTQQSLIEHLKRIVEPVPDFEYQDFVDLYHIVPVDDDNDEEELEEGLQDESSFEEEEEEEIDDEDLIDTKALGEARQLRASVRELSQGVQEIREQVLKDSLETNMKQEYNKLLEDLANRPSVDTDMSRIDESRRVALEEALRDLSSLLNDSQWSKLPQQLESLQSTIEVIQKNTFKDRPMSQTEAAIISRSNSADEQDNDWEALLSQESTSGGRGELLLTASDRLARFFELLE